MFVDRVISKEEYLGKPPRISFLRGSTTQKEAKADIAFKVFDKNNDGNITKEEMIQTSKNLTKKQVLFAQDFHFFYICKIVISKNYGKSS